MADSADIHFLTLPLGALTGATEVPLAFLPSGYGGITVLDAKLVGPSAGTAVGGLLVKMTNVGTPAIDGTVATFTTPAVTAAGVVHSSTINTAYVAEGKFLGYDQTSGTVPAGTNLLISYVMGK
jgi:hypothetical protein